MSEEMSQIYKSDNPLGICGEHPESMLMLCSTHDELFCSTCIPLEHKDCTVTRISDIASEFLNGKEHTELNERIDGLRKDIKAKKITVEENRQESNKNYLDNVEMVRTFRTAIEQYVAKMEENLLAECLKRKEENEQLFKDIEQQCITADGELESLLAENRSREERPVELFVQAKTANKNLAALEYNLKEMDLKNRVQLHEFKKSPLLSEMMTKESPIGQVKRIVTGYSELEYKDEQRAFENLRLERTGQIYVRLPTDQRNCWITGITCLKNDRLACADKNNKSVKIVDVNRGIVTNRVTLDSVPHDITNIYDYQLAVTMLQENKIEILMLDGLTKSYEIKLDGKCSGIAHKDRLLYVSYSDPPKVEVMYLEGDVWQRYMKDNFGVHLFRVPLYLDVAQDNNYEDYVVVTDHSTHYISKIKLDVKKHRDTDKIWSPNAVVILPDESLLVCDENHKVCHISSDLTRSRVLLREIGDGIANPDAMCFDKDKETLFLSNRLPGDHILKFKVMF